MVEGRFRTDGKSPVGGGCQKSWPIGPLPYRLISSTGVRFATKSMQSVESDSTWRVIPGDYITTPLCM